MARGGHRYGAGRPGAHEKAEHFRSIDVRRFHREGMLGQGSWSWRWRDADTLAVLAGITVIGGAEAIRLCYRMNGAPVETRIDIDRTACGYGGTRPWFRCPRCDGRVAILYLGSQHFACRRCFDLVYTSQSASDMAAGWARLRKVEALLGPHWSRPKGMHDATCDRLREEAFRLMRAATAVANVSLARLEASAQGLGPSLD